MKKLLIFIFFLNHFSSAQVASVDFSKSRAFYEKNDSYQFEVKLKMFPSETSKHFEDVGTGISKKKGNNYYSRFSEHEMICNAKGTVVINKKAKTCTFFEKSGKSMVEKQVMINFDSTLKACDSVRYKGLEDGSHKYVLYTKGYEIEKTEIYLDKHDYRINRIVCYYVNSNDKIDLGIYKMVIDYSGYVINEIPESDFSHEKIIKKGKTGYALTGSYSGYKLYIVPVDFKPSTPTKDGKKK